MPSILRQLQAEWNTLVPQAQARGIRRVRLLNAPLETIAYRSAKLQWLREQLSSGATFAQLTFGVELECLVPCSYHEVVEALRAAGVPACAPGYTHRTTSEWKVVSDGSVHTTRQVLGSRMVGAELVSPILRGEDGFAQLRKVCDVLVRLGATVNRSCGLHVHVGATTETPAFFRNLVKLYAQAEGALDTVVSPSRRGSANAYCGSLRDRVSHSRLDQATNLAQVTSAVGQSSTSPRSAGRYCKLNLQSFWQHGTVEFRQHQGTVEADKVDNWTRLVLKMFLAARDGLTLTDTTLSGLLAALQATDSERTFFTQRAASFASREQRRAA